MKHIKEYSWPGNSIELENVIRKALLDNKPPVLENISFQKHPEMIESNGDLSPLEASEQFVIFNQLQKNNYNKNKTSRELKITINTLNAKINRYGIAVPKKRNTFS
jgi:DNA-binding NtrC family response regulator